MEPIFRRRGETDEEFEERVRQRYYYEELNRKREKERIEKGFQAAVKRINEEKKKEHPDGKIIMDALYSLGCLFLKERQLKRWDRSAIETQCVALYPVIMKKGLELSLSRCEGKYDYLHQVKGEFKDEESEVSVSFGNVIRNEWGSIHTEYEIKKPNERARKVAHWTWGGPSFGNSNFADNELNGVAYTEMVDPFDGTISSDNYYFKLEYKNDQVTKSTVEHITTKNGRKSEASIDKMRLDLGVCYYYRNGRLVEHYKINYITNIISDVPLLTTMPGGKPLNRQFYVSPELIMRSFFTGWQVKFNPLDEYVEPDIESIINKVMDGKQDPNNKWKITIKGLTKYYRGLDRYPTAKELEYTDEEFKEEGLPLVLLISYLADRDVEYIRFLDKIPVDKGIFLPEEIEKFANNSVNITNGDNSFNHYLITDYDARNIIVSYLKRKGLKDNEISDIVKDLFDNIKSYVDKEHDNYERAIKEKEKNDSRHNLFGGYAANYNFSNPSRFTSVQRRDDNYEDSGTEPEEKLDGPKEKAKKTRKSRIFDEPYTGVIEKIYQNPVGNKIGHYNYIIVIDMAGALEYSKEIDDITGFAEGQTVYVDVYGNITVLEKENDEHRKR